MSSACSDNPWPALFPRSAKLLKPSDFKRVFTLNAASADGFFRVIARPSRASGHRLGMAVSKKVDRRAVGRNRIKRVVRESFRRWRAAQVRAAEGSFDIIVMPRAAAATSNNHQLFTSLEHHWSALDQRVAQRFSGDS
ncbi:MAG: ribonuclease P protein component [Xanthomonadales bacterium]|nr:ribonuclease P protein component [Gammaproteobacteria bacterium]MBT8050933.1 ribonuclease P protein component [Gammaproteobacteria bacterium]MBT8057293.1 ribonuclease P protein component [Gammaproteobacteria bacterium]NNJ78657.1 ribonuclease P protein component [Xanthomonadales bacterium]NNL04958.1 ribonuclease P protein component [Xanthomonadales bacterium]